MGGTLVSGKMDTLKWRPTTKVINFIKNTISDLKFRDLELRNVTLINWNLNICYRISNDYFRTRKDSLNIPIRCPKMSNF